jgi:hypothetical protein
MAVTVKISVKDFNSNKLQEELAALPLTGISWAGFIRLDDRRHTPFPEASRVVGRSSSTGDDVALRGELRFISSSSLTAPQNASLDSILSSHNSATLSAEQVREDQDESDMEALFASDRQVYLNHIQTWDTKSTANKLAAAKEMYTIIGKVLRVFIRRNRQGGGAI